MTTTIVVGESIAWAEKDKDSTPEYEFDVAAMMPDGDSVQACTWSVTPAGVTVASSSVSGAKIFAKFSGGTQKTWYALTATWTSAGGVTDQFTVRLFIKEDAEAVPQLGSALFPNRFTATMGLRRDQLLAAAQAVLSNVNFSDDYLWSKLLAAEAEVAHTLRVPLVPTQFFPNDPTQAEIDALNGKPWAIDPAYDYSHDFFQGDKWGYIVTRQKPINSVSRIRFVYPSPAQGVFDIPADWIRMDKKYGHIRLVPASTGFLGPYGAFMMQALGGGQMIPFAMEITYSAGLENVTRDYPELIDVVKKMAVLKIIEDSYLPQSGSISADGLSQSMTVDMAKYHDTIDTILNGPKGSNGGLMTAIHGIRFGVMGGA